MRSERTKVALWVSPAVVCFSTKSVLLSQKGEVKQREEQEAAFSTHAAHGSFNSFIQPMFHRHSWGPGSVLGPEQEWGTRRMQTPPRVSEPDLLHCQPGIKASMVGQKQPQEPTQETQVLILGSSWTHLVPCVTDYLEISQGPGASSGSWKKGGHGVSPWTFQKGHMALWAP